jgi:hypothetical protein
MMTCALALRRMRVQQEFLRQRVVLDERQQRHMEHHINNQQEAPNA